MNHSFFYSLISLAVGIFFVMCGITGVVITWSPAMRADMMLFLLQGSLIPFLFGIGSLVLGLIISLNVVLSNRRNYYHLRNAGDPVLIEETVIQQYLSDYWKRLFPQQDIPNYIILRKNKLQIIADLPEYPLAEQKALLEKIEEELSTLLKTCIGYNEKFQLYISFQIDSPQK